MRKSKTYAATTYPNHLAKGFCEVFRPTPSPFTIGFEAASERITAKLPRLVGASLIASGIATSDRQFLDLVTVLQMLVTADADSLTTPLPQPAKRLAPHLSRWR